MEFDTDENRPLFLEPDQKLLRIAAQLVIYASLFGFGYIAGAAGV